MKEEVRSCHRTMKKYRIWAQLIVDGDVEHHIDYDSDSTLMRKLWDEFTHSLTWDVLEELRTSGETVNE